MHTYVCMYVHIHTDNTCTYTYCVHVYMYMHTMYKYKYIRTAADLRDFGALTEGGVLFDKIAVHLHVPVRKKKSEKSVP
jgi:hypothetical protein